MNKRYIFLLSFLLLALHAFPQMYNLNEDFNGTSDTTPPGGWNIVVITGDISDSWHFDNPGQRTLN